MKTLYESILDVDDNERNFDKNIKDQIKQFLKDNYNGYSKCKISKKPNSDGKYEVSSKGDIEVKNYDITKLTNGLFVWTKVGGYFDCEYCKFLTSLEGAPEKVGWIFDCNNCNSLKTLKGAPEKVGGSFYCYCCDSLTSIEGAPKKVDKDFSCHCCGKRFTEEDIKKVSDVKGRIYY